MAKEKELKQVQEKKDQLEKSLNDIEKKYAQVRINLFVYNRADRLAQLLSIRCRCGDRGFNSQAGQIGTVSPRYRCDVSLKLCLKQ